jgi:short-subunit dehydrogenase
MGATSAIAHAYARRMATAGAALVLIGRNAERLGANAADLVARGGTASVEVLDLLAAIDRHAAMEGLVARHGLPDQIVIAYGILGDQKRALADLAHAREILEVNFTSVAEWLLAICARRDPSRALALVVIGSVAGDRGRGANFVYGAAKSGLERFVEGLQHANAGTSLSLVLVKPGFVDTPMTRDFDKSGPLWASPDTVARDIERAVARRAAVVYTPWFWRTIMLIIRTMPRFLFNRLKI